MIQTTPTAQRAVPERRSHSGRVITRGASLAASLGASFGASFGASLGASFGASLGASFGASRGASLGASFGASLVVALTLLSGCATVPSSQGTARTPTVVGQDPSLVPAGYGTLRQDDVAIRLALPGGLQVRAAPIDESFIRLLSPDLYRAMTELINSKREELDRLTDRVRLPAYSLWVVNFFAQEQGETRFSPMEIVIRNVGRDFRPLDVFPMTPGFGEYRLSQRETQSALFVFDGQVDPNQPLSIIVETVASDGWQIVLQRVERERSLIRSRASAQQRRDSTPPPSESPRADDSRRASHLAPTTRAERVASRRRLAPSE